MYLNWSFLFKLSYQLGTLKIHLGCTPLDPWSFSPMLWLQLFKKRIQSLFSRSSFCKPNLKKELYPIFWYIPRYTSVYFGENQLYEFDSLFTTFDKSSDHLATWNGSILHQFFNQLQSVHQKIIRFRVFLIWILFREYSLHSKQKNSWFPSSTGTW